MAFTESAPSHRLYKAAVTMLVKRLKLRTSKISIRTMKEGQLSESGEGRSTPRINSRNSPCQSTNLVCVDGEDRDSYSIFILRLPLLSILTVKLRGPSYHHMIGAP